METAVETPTATSEAESYAEHKAAREAEKSGDTKSGDASAGGGNSGEVQVRKNDGADTAESKPTDETGAAGGTQNSEAHSGGTADRPKKEKSSAEKRFAELTEKARKAEEERDRLARELEEARKPKPSAEAPKSETKSDDEPEPNLKDFVAKLKAGETYEDAVQQFARADRAWENRQRQKTEAATAREREQASIKESMGRKVAEARTKYEDFDIVTAGDAKAGTGLILTPAMQQFVYESPAGMDVAYQLGKNPDEVKRIATLSPALQIAELALMARGKTETPAAEKPKLKASNAPAPPKTVGGTAPQAAKDTSEAGSYAEHKRLREQYHRK